MQVPFCPENSRRTDDHAQWNVKMGKEVTEYVLCGLWVYPSDPEQRLKPVTIPNARRFDETSTLWAGSCISTKEYLHNLHSSISTYLSNDWRVAKIDSSLGDILVSALQGQVNRDVQCQAPGLQPPTPACVIRKAIRSNHTLLANYCLSEGGSLSKLDLESKPTCAALSPPLLSFQGFIGCSPSLLGFKHSQESSELCSFLMDFKLWPKWGHLKIAMWLTIRSGQ